MRRQVAQRDWIGVRWGFPCSALFHLAIVALALFALPEPRKPRALPKEIPVEIVRKAPEKKPASKPKTQARKTPPAAERPKPKSPKEPLAKPKQDEDTGLAKNRVKPAPKRSETEKTKKDEKPLSLAEEKPALKPSEPPRKPTSPPKQAEDGKPSTKPALVPEAKKPTARKPVEDPLPAAKKPKPLPPPKPRAAVKEPQLALGPKPPALRPKPAPPPKPKTGSLKVPPNLGAVPYPDAKTHKLLGQWVLRPLTLDTGHRCGSQRVTGTMNLVKRRVRGGGAEVQYLAEIRTTIFWERCRPEGVLRKLVLIQRGERVFLVDAKGVLDHGLMRGNVMILRDSLGDSYWRLRR